MTLQDATLQLLRFWTARGCRMLLPCDFEIPAGLFHPDAFFNLTGDAPRALAWAQPVRRPLDGRSGLHPFRMARHLQFQVLIPEPDLELRQVYLESLCELGCDLRQHDLRFAEWRFEARSLSALGVGWHVLLDGLGITRWTFLREVAGRSLEPAAVEISYGVERLMMAISGVADAYALPWSEDGSTWGDLRRADEIELTRWVDRGIDAEALGERLAALVAESERALEEGCPRLAYELAVRALQPVDLLEARGALSALERESWLERLRARVLAVAGAIDGSTAEAA